MMGHHHGLTPGICCTFVFLYHQKRERSQGRAKEKRILQGMKRFSVRTVQCRTLILEDVEVYDQSTKLAI